MTILATLAAIFGIVGGLANFPQALKIFRRKSAKDISIITYALLFMGALVWIMYGIELGNFAVFATNLFGAVNIGLVIIGWFWYGRK